MESLSRTIISLKEQTREALARALRGIRKSYTEAELSEAWLRELRQNPDLYPDGWYDPPPHGVISLFGKATDNFERVRHSSFRPREMWPAADRAYTAGDIMMVYASPVDRNSLLLGDFGLSLYQGSDVEIVRHLERVIEISMQIANSAEPGMPFHELYSIAIDLGRAAGLTNDIESSTDLTGTNIGHSIPLSFHADPTHDIVKDARSFEEIRHALSTGRKFINARETQLIHRDMAFTVEPRFSTKAIPNCWFHLTVVFEGGIKRVCHGFEPVLKEMGMDYILKILESQPSQHISFD
jgi:hypothetical protein